MERKKVTLNLADYVDVTIVKEEATHFCNVLDKTVEYVNKKREFWVLPQFERPGSLMKWLNSVDEVFE